MPGWPVVVVRMYVMDNVAMPMLLTGFEPFADHAVNPSWDAADAVARMFPAQVIALRLPVDYHAARDRLLATLESLQPSICLCMGVCRRSGFFLEHRARKPTQFQHMPGPAEMQGHWPWLRTAVALQNAQFPIEHSSDAGQYVCESTYWTLLNYQQSNSNLRHAAFLHVPSIADAVTVQYVTQAVEAIVRDILCWPEHETADERG